jgi:hypothetical protein
VPNFGTLNEREPLSGGGAKVEGRIAVGETGAALTTPELNPKNAITTTKVRFSGSNPAIGNFSINLTLCESNKKISFIANRSIDKKIWLIKT